MSQWYLIQAKPKQEARAKEHLENQGVECFYPTIEIEKIVRGKRQKRLEPLFHNYIFIKLDDADSAWSKIRSTRGVRDFVRFGKDIAKVPVLLIKKIKKDTANFDPDTLESNVPKPGDKVRVTEGAFKDLEGIYRTKNGEERSIILLDLLSQSVEIEVSNRDVIKVEK